MVLAAPLNNQLSHMERKSGENWPCVAKSRTPTEAGVAAAYQLCRNNREVTGGLFSDGGRQFEL